MGDQDGLWLLLFKQFIKAGGEKVKGFQVGFLWGSRYFPSLLRNTQRSPNVCLAEAVSAADMSHQCHKTALQRQAATHLAQTPQAFSSSQANCPSAGVLPSGHTGRAPHLPVAIHPSFSNWKNQSPQKWREVLQLQSRPEAKAGWEGGV